MKAQAVDPNLANVRRQAKDYKPLALLYCAAKGRAEVIGEQVEAIARRLLAEECPLKDDEGVQILEPKYYWLCEDDDALKAYYAAQNRELRAAGIKPADMDDEFCPALVANTEAIKLRHQLVNAMAPLVGIDPHWLWGDKEEEFFQLAMNLILAA